jgi:hypothetical protein
MLTWCKTCDVENAPGQSKVRQKVAVVWREMISVGESA